MSFRSLAIPELAPKVRSLPLPKSFRSTVLASALMMPCIGFADEPNLPSLWAATEDGKTAARGASQNTIWDTGVGKSYWIPALEIISFDVLLNQVDRHFVDRSGTYNSNLSSITRNLHSGWVVDRDRFDINELGHPYQGSIYHGIARSTGLGFWESAAYTFAGSVFWELAGETTPPSRNDQVASGIGGVLLGEPLFRMANLVLEHADGTPRFWREAAAAVISPPTGFNRLAFGDRYKGIFQSRDPAYYGRLQLGAATSTQNEPGTSAQVKRSEALADFSMDYGLPGKPDYTYRRPFDYFNFQAIASSANGVESVMTRGLLVGKDYEAGNNYRGVWGLYGSYDYIAPQLFRVSSTALSVGTTAQWSLPKSFELQGTGLLGVGYAAVGAVNSTDTHDNHYGVAPQALLALRLIYSDKASIDISAREYFVSNVGSAGQGGHDNIARADISFTWRIYHQHAISFKYLITRRDAVFPDLGDRTQTRATVGVFYTLLGHDRFGAVDWRRQDKDIR
jgi:hypothetical protein